MFILNSLLVSPKNSYQKRTHESKYPYYSRYVCAYTFHCVGVPPPVFSIIYIVTLCLIKKINCQCPLNSCETLPIHDISAHFCLWTKLSLKCCAKLINVGFDIVL